MSPTELLTDLRQRGFELTAEGDQLRVAPSSKLDADLRELIRAHKPALLSELRAELIQGEAARQMRATIHAVAARYDSLPRERRFDLSSPEWRKIADAVDAAFLARDMDRLATTLAA